MCATDTGSKPPKPTRHEPLRPCGTHHCSAHHVHGIWSQCRIKNTESACTLLPPDQPGMVSHWPDCCLCSYGFELRRDGRLLTLWNEDTPAQNPDVNLYGSHPFYMEVLPSASARPGCGHRSCDRLLLSRTPVPDIAHGRWQAGLAGAM